MVGPAGDRMTYAEMMDKVDRIANNLAATGIKAGDVISLQLPNWPEFVLVHLAAQRLGAVTNPLLPNYRAKELFYILKFADSKAVFIPSVFRGFNYLTMYAELKKDLPHLRHVYVIGADAPEGMSPFTRLIVEPKARVNFAAYPAPDYNDVTLLAFTSGTESSPKGVMHSHNTLMYGTLTMARLSVLRPMTSSGCRRQSAMRPLSSGACAKRSLSAARLSFRIFGMLKPA